MGGRTCGVAAKQLGVDEGGVHIDPDSLEEQGKHIASDPAYPGLITEYYSAMVCGDLREGYEAGGFW